MSKNYVDWAISSQAPYRRRFNDYLCRAQAIGARSSGPRYTGDDIVYSSTEIVEMPKGWREVANRVEYIG